MAMVLYSALEAQVRVTRRDGLKAAALALAAPLSTASVAAQIGGSHASGRIGLAVSTYSY